MNIVSALQDLKEHLYNKLMPLYSKLTRNELALLIEKEVSSFVASQGYGIKFRSMPRVSFKIEIDLEYAGTVVKHIVDLKMELPTPDKTIIEG